MDEKKKEYLEKIIRHACEQAGVTQKAEQFINDGRSWPWVRDWLIANTRWRPNQSKATIDVEKIYARFNGKLKKEESVGVTLPEFE
jgi:hypothetical protein